MSMEVNRIMVGDCVEQMQKLPAGCVHTCVTSPPYFGLRDYKVHGQIGQEPTPAEFVSRLLTVFLEVRRVLRDDGTLWLNLGDSYATGGGKVGRCPGGGEQGERFLRQGMISTQANRMKLPGLKAKELIGIPWKVAFALQDAGWYLRQDIIWSKPNPMPESVKDRCTKSHEYLFLLSKSKKYYFDQEAILEPCSPNTHARLSQDVQNQIGSERANGGEKTNGNMKAVGRKSWNGSEFHTGKTGEHQLNRAQSDRKYDPSPGNKNNPSFDAAMEIMPEKRNRRSVWSVPTTGYKGAHFATFPPKLIEPCILAGCPAGGLVLDPFGGSGTTAQVARHLGRNWIICELNPDYVTLAQERIDKPLVLHKAKKPKPAPIIPGQLSLFAEETA